MKVLIVAHGHPNFSKGGGEMAAYGHFEELLEQGHDAYYLGWNSTAESSDRPLEKINSREWLISTKVDFFNFSTIKDDALDGYHILLNSLKPEVVHFHHFIHLGIELPSFTKKIVGGVKVYLTLHEYLLACNNNGQMIKTNGQLCYRASPQECNKCFPNISAEAFFMREGYIKNCISIIDHFFSPSAFLMERMVDWGIPSSRISVIENILKLPAPVKQQSGSKARISKIGFFGQINPYKGLDVVLDAFDLVLKRIPTAHLYINGKISEINQPEYNHKLNEKMEKLTDSVTFRGAYSPETLPARLAEVGWIVMGSRWWENSPVVIQEAFAAGIPAILPDLGGMAEQLARTKFGLQYPVADPIGLAEKMAAAFSMSEAEYAALLKRRPRVPANKEILHRLHQLYQNTV